MMGQEENISTIDPQMESPFFRILPQEIRDLVWVLLFSSTRITVGYVERDTSNFVDVKPAPNALAALHVCRRARLEIGDSWLGHVLFYFPGIEPMFEKLSVLSVDALAKLRHVRVSGEHILYAGKGPNKTEYCFSILYRALRRLPGLQLDQLTVLGGRLPESNYIDLLSLIKMGNGWKTLRYLDRSSALIGFRAGTFNMPVKTICDEYIQQPQPSAWKRMLENRDGIASAPSVTIYRAIELGSNGAMFDPARRVEFKQVPGERGVRYWPDDDELLAAGQEEKEMLVVVKRGAGADYRVKDMSASELEDMANGIPEDWPYWRDRIGDPIVDTYQDVEEYAWLE